MKHSLVDGQNQQGTESVNLFRLIYLQPSFLLILFVLHAEKIDDIYKYINIS